ncbi:MAG TPA: hypothetical protein VEX13_07285 [Chloroflexia bacterium]|nr:hypothetical protein [Chloroflexia bacterium]
MKMKLLIGSAIATALVGVGVLAGSVIGADRVGAQTPSVTPQPTTAPAKVPTTDTAKPPADFPYGGRGRHGHGPGGFGHKGFSGGKFGQGATTDNATRQITNVTDLITLVKGDLAYATGKMDTADVARWLAGAESLLTSAQSANTGSNYGQAVAYAGAAGQLAMTAQHQMARELGANVLPSYSQRPQRGNKGIGAPANVTVTQAQASFILAETYNRLQEQSARVKAASNASEATPYLTDAQNTYKEAYDAYQAGNYSDAAAFAMLAGKLGGVADTVVRASTAPANADTPVAVPAPNF